MMNKKEQSSHRVVKPVNIRRSNGVHPSLVDIAFVLVFLFLIVSTLAKVEEPIEEELNLPPIELPEMEEQEGNDESLNESSKTITILSASHYALDESEYKSIEGLRKDLEFHQPTFVELRCDVNVPYGEVSRILEVCHEMGIDITLSYKKPA